jgi:multidrug efflux system outer membrane protein
MNRLSVSIAIIGLASGSCSFGPDYAGPPDVVSDVTFKNAGFANPPASGSWWSFFQDAELTRIVASIQSANPSARAALARYDQARATLGLERVDEYPALTGDAYLRRQSDSDNSNFSAGTYNDYRAALNLSWELDLWGRVRKQVGSASAEFEASGYDYQAALLSLQAEAARNYLSLRSADSEIQLLEATAELRGEARRLTEKRFEKGASSRIEAQRAITEHETVLGDLATLRAARGRLENALAALTGQSASAFRMAAKPGSPRIPAAPSTVPGELLRRRPDIAAAERRLAASSERIGLVVATYLPRISITAEGGVRSLSSSDLFKPDSALWNLGPEIELPVFQGGALGQNRKLAEAAYRESLERYRDTLLNAVRETEDSMGDLHHLATASSARKRGADSAAQAATLTRKRYDAGVTDYFEVVDAERTALAEQRSAVQVELARALAATRMIQSLGGGWTR